MEDEVKEQEVVPLQVTSIIYSIYIYIYSLSLSVFIYIYIYIERERERERGNIYNDRILKLEQLDYMQF